MIGCGRRVGGRREDWRRGEVGKEIEKVQKHSSFFHRQKNIKTCLKKNVAIKCTVLVPKVGVIQKNLQCTVDFFLNK